MDVDEKRNWDFRRTFRKKSRIHKNSIHYNSYVALISVQNIECHNIIATRRSKLYKLSSVPVSIVSKPVASNLHLEWENIPSHSCYFSYCRPFYYRKITFPKVGKRARWHCSSVAFEGSCYWSDIVIPSWSPPSS